MNSSEKIRCLLLPTLEYKLILPHSTVEEVLPFAVITDEEGKKNYIIGMINWHRINIPLLSMEVLDSKEKPEIKRRTRAAVIKLIGSDGDVNYFSIILSGMPKMIVLSPEDIHEIEEEKHPACTLQKVSVKGETAYIPDMSALEYVLNKAR